MLTPFLEQGLARREKVLCVIDVHNAEVILDYLRDVGVDADGCVSSGQLVLLTRADVYFRDGHLDPENMIAFLRSETERALAEGWTALRGTAETTWALHGEPGSERLMEYEAKLNSFFPGSRCLALCQYDRRRFAPEVLLDVLHTHPTVFFGEELVDNPYYLPPDVFLSDLTSARFLQWANALRDAQRGREERTRIEQQFLSFAEAADQVFWITELDPERVVYVSPAFERTWNRPVGDLKEGPRIWMETIHSEDRASVREAFERWTRGEPGARFDVTYRINTPDSQIRWISDRGIVLAREEGRISRVGGIAEDVTEKVRAEERERREAERRRVLLEIYQQAPGLTDRQLYDDVLEKAVFLTASTIGLLHLVSDDQRTVILTTWSRGALESCTAPFDTDYPVSEAGNWADCLRSRRPVIYNDYATSPNRKGLPSGHTPVQRFVSVPVVEGDKVRLIIGVGNKEEEYDESDVVQLQLVASELMRVIRQRRASEALEESERRYRDIFNHASDCLCLVEPSEGGDFRYLEVNPAYERATGIPRARLIGSTRLEALTKEVAGRVNASCSRCLAEGAIIERTFELEVPAGRRTFQSTFIPVQDEAGRITRVLGVNRDVTERLRAEGAIRAADRQLRTLMDSFPDFIARFDREGRHLYVNPAVVRAFGVPLEDIVGKTLRELPPRGDPEQVDTLLSGIKEAFDSGVPNSLDVVWPTPGGDRHFEVRHVPELSEGGDVVSVLGITRDVTDVKRAEQERQAHLRLLGSLDQVNRAIQGTNDLEEMMSNVLEAVLSIFDCDRAWLFHPCDPQAPSFRVPMEVTKPEYPGASALNVDVPMPRDMAENLREALESADPVVYVSGTDRPINRVSAEQFGVKSMMMVALRPKRGEPWAFGLHHCSAPHTWTEEDQRLFNEIGRRLTDALTSLLTLRNLRESEGKLADAQSIAHVGHWDLDVEADRIAGSDETFRILGVPKQGANLKLDRFLQLVHPEDRHVVARAVSTAVDGDSPHEAEFRVVQPAGEIRYVHSQWDVTQDELGRPSHLFGTLQDVTERRQLEEEMRRSLSAVEHAAEAIVISDPAGVIQYVNPAFTRVTGYTREESVGRNPSIVKSGRHAPAFYQELWATIRRGDVWHGHLVNRRKDGTLFEEDATISPVRDERGNVVHYVAVKRDVTQEVALEAQLRQSQKMEAIGRLAGGIAHDFNNLLQAMLSVTQLLRAAPQRGEAELAELEAQVRRGAALTRQLLLFSRRETTRRELLDLSEVVVEAGTFLRRLVRANVEVAVEAPDCPVIAEADVGQLQQVLMNLAINAADAMPLGGNLTIRTGTSGEQVWFEVQDTGHGIPEEIRDTIFDPFFTTKPAGLGTGLGLSVVHGIVKQHGGRIEVESADGAGSLFRVLLPNRCSALEPVVTADCSVEAPPTGRGQRVLVVEDETAVRESLRELLISLGYNVTAVSAGAEAGRLVDLPAFDVLLTDLMLADVEGHVLARRLLDRWPKMRVILMSGYSQGDAVQSCADLAPVELLQKPFGVGVLARAMRRAVGGE